MIYLNEKNLKRIGIDWNDTIEMIEKATRAIETMDFAQPIKPYLRYRNLTDRIIAMPAFVGADIDLAGIKWIASFPGNINSGIPRAHSVMVLNESSTGKPLAIINTALLSVIRTASVSGLLIKHFDSLRNLDKINIGIIGWGPIGQYHFKMATSLLGDRISKIFLFDLMDIDKATIEYDDLDKINITSDWKSAYKDSDIFITCTVSKAPYIDMKPKPGSLQLNVSLRDYKADIYDYVKDAIIVDDWEEVCREKTDIEMLHIEKGLQAEDTKSIVDVVCGNCLKDFPEDQPVMFNPMGMAIFDVALARYYMDKAEELQVGLTLD